MATTYGVFVDGVAVGVTIVGDETPGARCRALSLREARDMASQILKCVDVIETRMKEGER